MDADLPPAGDDPVTAPTVGATDPPASSAESEVRELRRRNAQLEADVARWRSRAIDGWDQSLDGTDRPQVVGRPDPMTRVRSAGSRAVRVARRVPGVRRLAELVLAGLRALGAPG